MEVDKGIKSGTAKIASPIYVPPCLLAYLRRDLDGLADVLPLRRLSHVLVVDPSEPVARHCRFDGMK